MNSPSAPPDIQEPLGIVRRSALILGSSENRHRILGLLALFAGLGGVLDALGITGLLRFVLGLFFVNFGVFLHDVAATVGQGQTTLPRYPGATDVLGVALPSLVFGVLASGLWVPAVLLDFPAGEVMGGAASVCLAVLVSLGQLGFPSGAVRRPLWFAVLVCLSSAGAAFTFLLRQVEARAFLFAPLSVAAPLLVVIVAAAAFHEAA